MWSFNICNLVKISLISDEGVCSGSHSMQESPPSISSHTSLWGSPERGQRAGRMKGNTGKPGGYLEKEDEKFQKMQNYEGMGELVSIEKEEKSCLPKDAEGKSRKLI